MKSKMLVGAGLAVCAIAWAAKDPVIMTINGVDVPKSEFEYLYHKNSQQQLKSQPIEEYAEMFKIYKLKVADALANKVDTLASFKRDMQTYRNDLAQPYLADSVLINKLVDEAYRRNGEEVSFSHIMFQKSMDPEVNANVRNMADSVRKLLVNGGDFTSLAKQWSADRSVQTNGGNLGFISAGLFPYSIEKAAFDLKEGDISDIVESPVGYHILKGGAHRPSRGSVAAAHILKLVPENATPEQEKAIKATVDSICDVLKSDPSKFEKLAAELSDDKGSARSGGLVGWFAAGRMVPEFDNAAFALPLNGISEPVRSKFGWHIIKKVDEKGPKSYAEVRNEQLTLLQNPQDERYTILAKDRTRRLSEKHKASLNKETVERLRERARLSGIDSTFYAEFGSAPLCKLPLATIDKNVLTVGDLLKEYPNMKSAEGGRAALVIDNVTERYFAKNVDDAEIDWLFANEPDFHNLMNEYRDGSLLYEISVQKVWDKASKDKEGLQQYFEAHRDDYKWNEPRVKGILIQTRNDSVADLVRKRLPELGNDTIVSTLRKEFRSDLGIERVLVTKGANAMVDNLMFNGLEVKPSIANFTTYFLYNPVILDAPEEYTDVRGMVISDYQTALENAWINELREKYPVKVNEKVLKNVK
ncbi:MAG: hypothetical protein HDS80_04265 [Bacteroidales bacterium]|nr:hypothetical protein [Bacteroidales bacterium]